MTSHGIDYKIIGDDIQFVDIEPDQGETVIAETGTVVQSPGTFRQEQRQGSGLSSGINSREVSIKYSVLY